MCQAQAVSCGTEALNTLRDIQDKLPSRSDNGALGLVPPDINTEWAGGPAWKRRMHLTTLNRNLF